MGTLPFESCPHFFLAMPSRNDILLINPWIYDFTAYDFWLRPLGLLYIASILRENARCRVYLIDCLDRHHPFLSKRTPAKLDGRGHYPKEEVDKPAALKGVPRRYSRYGIPIPLFLDELKQVPRPEAVLITSTMTYWYPGVQLVVELIRRKWGSVPVILGGVYATLLADHARRHSGADFVVEGKGENKILPLMKKILGDGAVRLHAFKGLEDMPPPAFDLLRNRQSLSLLTSRGCPFRCTFCATPLLYRAFEQRPPRSVFAEAVHCVERFRTKHFAFYDDALLVGKNGHIIPILEAVAEKKLDIRFHTPNGLHIREIDPGLAFLFRKAGVDSLYLSQESFDEQLLSRSCPKVSTLDLERALGVLEEAGYSRRNVNVYLIFGLPDQDLSSVRDSIRRVRALGAKPRLAYFSPLPGTEEWSRLVARRILPADADPLLHNKLAFAYIWGGLSRQDFEGLRSLLEA